MQRPEIFPQFRIRLESDMNKQKKKKITIDSPRAYIVSIFIYLNEKKIILFASLNIFA